MDTFIATRCSWKTWLWHHNQFAQINNKERQKSSSTSRTTTDRSFECKLYLTHCAKYETKVCGWLTFWRATHAGASAWSGLHNECTRRAICRWWKLCMLKRIVIYFNKSHLVALFFINLFGLIDWEWEEGTKQEYFSKFNDSHWSTD